MITWLFWVDSWEFPTSKSMLKVPNQPIAVDAVSVLDISKKSSFEGESEAEKQLRWHKERWDYRDPSRYVFIPDQMMPLDNPRIPDWDPPERDYETWEQDRPGYYEDQYRERDGYDWWHELLEEGGRAQAV